MTTLEKLLSTHELIKRQEKLQKHLKTILSEIDEKANQLDNLKKKMDEEEDDMVDLEKVSMKGLFYKVFSDKEAKLDKERQEFIQASLEYNEMVKALEILNYEKDILQQKQLDKVELNIRIKELQKEREEELLSEVSSKRNALRALIKKMKDNRSISVEYAEAMEIGEQAFLHLDRSKQLLKKAKDWGNWDMVSKSNPYVKYRKHGNIDNAKDEIFRASNLLHRLDQELQDIGKGLTFKLSDRLFDKLSRSFFDNIISDWMLQQRLSKTLEEVEWYLTETKKILASLKKDQKKLTRISEKLEDKRIALLMTN